MKMLRDMKRDIKDVGHCWENAKRHQENMYFLNDKEC
jgi:hypothetical protein